MSFSVPIVWREPTDLVRNCHFCLTPSMKKESNQKKKSSIEYSSIPSAIRLCLILTSSFLFVNREIYLLCLDDVESNEKSSFSESYIFIDKKSVLLHLNHIKSMEVN